MGANQIIKIVGLKYLNRRGWGVGVVRHPGGPSALRPFALNLICLPANTSFMRGSPSGVSADIPYTIG